MLTTWKLSLGTPESKESENEITDYPENKEMEISLLESL